MQTPQASPSNPQKVTSLGKIIFKHIFISIKSYGTSPREKNRNNTKENIFFHKRFQQKFSLHCRKLFLSFQNYFYLNSLRNHWNCRIQRLCH
jgi:hypothetical protein